MRYVFHPAALTEYAQAVQFYTEHRVELAQAFINAVENAIFRLVESPTRWPIVDEDIRRCLTRKFPYGILYITILWTVFKQPEYDMTGVQES
jgi:hypothetical protein